MRKTLLIEVGVEELPSASVQLLGDEFASQLSLSLQAEKLVEGTTCQAFSTPNRLSVLIPEVLGKQANCELIREGPPLTRAYDQEGNPTLAAQGFAKTCGVAVNQLKPNKTGERVCCKVKQKGQSISVVLKKNLPEVLNKLTQPKRMRWSEGSDMFIRPVRSLCIVHGEKTLRGIQVFGVSSNNKIRIHRNEQGKMLPIDLADDYEKVLGQAGVIGNFQTRRQKIVAELKHGLQALGRGWELDCTEQMIEEATGATEYPQVLTVSVPSGKDALPHLMALPAVIKRSVLRDAIKVFPIISEGTSKEEGDDKFMLVANLAKDIDGKAVGQGYAQVAAAKLNDAKFFFYEDQTRSSEFDKKNLNETCKKQIQGIMFERKLGSMQEKCMRNIELAQMFCPEHKKEISELVYAFKYDLATETVTEYPCLEGTVGKYLFSKVLSKPQCLAIEEQYLPRHAGDVLPQTKMGMAIALADRLDTIVGLFSIGRAPTGTKDPFALRRAAIGIVRILVENEMDFDLIPAIQKSLACYKHAQQTSSQGTDAALDETACLTAVAKFIRERLKRYAQDQAYRPDQIQASMASDKEALRPLDFYKRLDALDGFFKKSPVAAANLAQANKRIANILQGQDLPLVEKLKQVKWTEQQEVALWECIDNNEKDIQAHLEQKNYMQALQLMAKLRDPIDAFFDKVMVMAEDQEQRKNRISLLARVRRLFLQVADFSLIVVKGEKKE